MSSVEVAVVGAGPYGLSVAAHLRGAGVGVRQFGVPMGLWETRMPAGMFLKSQGFASNLSDPAGRYTLAAFCAQAGHPYAAYGWPVPLEVFTGYGHWFAARAAPGVEETLVTRLAAAGSHGFAVTLASGESLTARRVVVAAGVEHFAHLPAPLDTLPPAACTHASGCADLAVFNGQRVAVIGAGQSALETAALLHESGAAPTLIARAAALAWNGPPLDPGRPLPRRLREPESGLGSGWGTWFYSNHPALYRHLPPATRAHRAATALGPAGASWLRPRFEGKIPALTGHTLTAATTGHTETTLTLATPAGAAATLTADHIIAGTGYQPRLAKLTFIDPALTTTLATTAGTPHVDRHYQAATPGLYITGPAVAPTYGPVMRFVYGTHHAATTITHHITNSVGRAGR